MRFGRPWRRQSGAGIAIVPVYDMHTQGIVLGAPGYVMMAEMYDIVGLNVVFILPRPDVEV